MVDETMETLEALVEVLQPEFQVVQSAVARRWTFALGHFPSVVKSDAEPPLRVDRRTEVIPIDELLGRYDPSRMEITIFLKGIERASEILNVPPSHLERITSIHEWAHGLLHVGFSVGEQMTLTTEPSSWNARLADATSWFRELDSVLHERLAQLLTYHGLSDQKPSARSPKAIAALNSIATSFDQLMRRQGPEYQIKDYEGVPRSRIVDSIGLLKGRTLVGVKAWDTVIRW